MQMRESSNENSQVLLEPLEPLGAADLKPGDVVEVTVRTERSPEECPKTGHVRIIVNAQTGIPAVTFGEGAPIITSEMVAEILADFP